LKRWWPGTELNLEILCAFCVRLFTLQTNSQSEGLLCAPSVLFKAGPPKIPKERNDLFIWRDDVS
jgi:hypothetical protein